MIGQRRAFSFNFTLMSYIYYLLLTHFRCRGKLLYNILSKSCYIKTFKKLWYFLWQVLTLPACPELVFECRTWHSMGTQGLRLHHLEEGVACRMKRKSDDSTISTYVSWIDLFAEVWCELALLERVEVDGGEDQGNHPAHCAVDSEDHLRSWKYMHRCQSLSTSIQLTMCLYEHPTKDSATESTKAMVDTLAGKEILNAYLTIEHIWTCKQTLWRARWSSSLSTANLKNALSRRP